MSMMRQLLHRRYWDRIKERNARNRAGVASSWYTQRPPGFIDYFIEVPGTLPEKMIFNALVERGISFAFSWFFGDYPGTEEEEKIRPDFYLLDYNIVIEISGWYWHTRDGMFEYDMKKFITLTVAGYKVYYLNDLEIIAKGANTVLDAEIPELAGAYFDRRGEIFIGEQKFDPTKAIKSRIQKWPRKNYSRWKDTIYGKPGVESYWQAGRSIRKASAPISVPFTHDLVADLLGELYGRFGGDYEKYLQHLTEKYGDIDDPDDERIDLLYWFWGTWFNLQVTDYTPWRIPIGGSNVRT